MEIKASQMTDGINLSKKEFMSVSKAVNNMGNKIGKGTYTDSDDLKKEFKSQMRQVFDAHILFEDLKVKDDNPCTMSVVACRFSKNRPLIFLAFEETNKTWFVLDEKRFPVLEDSSPFAGVNI